MHLLISARYWYAPLVADESFPASCRNVVVNALLSVHAHLSQKRSADTFMLFMVSTVNTFIVFLRELATARSSLATYIEDAPSSALAQMVDRDVQKRRLRMAADDMVQTFFGKEVLECEPVRVFLTEMLAGVVLQMTVDKCSEADWINEWILFLLDEETQPEILQKIDIGEATTAATNGKDVDAEERKAKRLSRAEEEMKQAMEEAQEMSRMLAEAEEEEKRKSMSIPRPEENGVEKEIKLPPPPSEMDTEFSPRANGFTSFDQMPAAAAPVPSTPPAFQDALHRAIISVSDLTPPTATSPTHPEKTLRSKPNSAMYLLQIEPSSPLIPGWIVTRKYTDIESLHEVLRRISNISGLDGFSQKHAAVPTWRGATPNTLRDALECYLNDALRERELAESEGMKRFLEKDTGISNVKNNSNPFAALGKGFPNTSAFAKMGAGALDALAKAPKGVAEGGKGLFGGMTRALGAQRAQDNTTVIIDTAAAERERKSSSSLDLRRRSMTDSGYGEYSRNSSRASTPLPARIPEDEPLSRDDTPPSLPMRSSMPLALPPRIAAAFPKEPPAPLRPQQQASPPSREGYIQLELPMDDGEDGDAVVSLPPPPSDMPDDYEYDVSSSRTRSASIASNKTTTSTKTTASMKPTASAKTATSISTATAATTSSANPLTTQETQFIVEIFFALLSELYTLSSAWTLRRSLLAIAKSILLRPGNATLETIRVLLQETVIDGWTSDAAVAARVRSLRAAACPTAEEKAQLAKDEAEGNADRGTELRVKARKLFCARAVPEAIRGVMGAWASEEALGEVFDALQVRAIGRGIVGGVVLEGVRGVCQ